jgi:hypothetical protein
MPEYKIMRWDAVIPPKNTFPYPMVYIKPDENFQKYIEENNYLFKLDISDTGMDYDQKSVVGMVFNSGVFPNLRPNFFNDTGYYSIVLFTNWIGYPSTNGKIILQGTKGPDSIGEVKEPEFVVPKPIEFFNNEKVEQKENKTLSMSQIGWIVILILVLFSVLLFISSKK